MLADNQWLAFHERHSIGKVAIYYASPHNKIAKPEPFKPLFCTQRGGFSRNIIAVGRIQAQRELDQNKIWEEYGIALGASTEAEWRKQASKVLENSLRKYHGKILAIELVDFRTFPSPVTLQSVGLENTRWQKRKKVDSKATRHLLQVLEGESFIETDETEKLTQIPSVGAGFGHLDRNKQVEQAACSTVKKLYESEGWAVRSVELDKCGYDFECNKDGVIKHVEVKGVSGADQRFIITANEVNQALTNPYFVLIVVTAALSASPELHRYTGDEFYQHFGLSVVQYRAALRESGST